MTELFDTSGIGDDPKYWDSLAARVARNAMMRASARDVTSFAGSTRGWLTALLLTGIAAGVLQFASPQPSGQAADESPWWSDNLGRAIAAAPNPPSIGSLLLSQTGAR